MYTYVCVLFAMRILKTGNSRKKLISSKCLRPYIVSDCYCYCCHHITDFALFCLVWFRSVLCDYFCYIFFSLLSVFCPHPTLVHRFCHSYEQEIYSFHVHIFVGICWILSLRCVFPIHFVNFHSVFFFSIFFAFYRWNSVGTNAFLPWREHFFFISMRYFWKWPICSMYVLYQPNDDFVSFSFFHIQFILHFLFQAIHIMNMCEWMCDRKKKFILCRHHCSL